MKSNYSKTMLWVATMMALPLTFTSCEDSFSEWDSPVTPSNVSTPETPYASNEYKEGKWEGGKLSYERKAATAPTEVADASTTQSWSGWYTVTGNVTIDEVTLSDDTNLILCDGAQLTIKKQIDGNQHTLMIYGQGEGTGKLIVGVAPYSDHAMSQIEKLQVHGGVISLTSQKDGIYASDSRVQTLGGKLIVESTADESSAINAHGAFMYGGEVIAKGKKYGIKASDVFAGECKLWAYGETGSAYNGWFSTIQGAVFEYSNDGSWTDTPTSLYTHYIRTKGYNPEL